MRISTSVLALALLPALALGPVNAAPSQPEPPPASAPVKKVTPKQCKGLKKTSRAFKNCVKKYASLFDDEELYLVGLSLAVDDRAYADALSVLQAVRNQRDPRVLTMIGFAMRKTGQLDQAFTYYGEALTLDANNVQTREYLGEAMLQKGDITGARAQLLEIAARCGVTCETYETLEGHIKKAEANAL